MATTRPCDFCGKEFAKTTLKQCSRCKAAFYCGRDCQVGAYASHKAECRKTVAEMKAAAASEEGNDIPAKSGIAGGAAAGGAAPGSAEDQLLKDSGGFLVESSPLGFRVRTYSRRGIFLDFTVLNVLKTGGEVAGSNFHVRPGLLSGLGLGQGRNALDQSTLRGVLRGAIEHLIGQAFTTSTGDLASLARSADLASALVSLLSLYEMQVRIDINDIDGQEKLCKLKSDVVECIAFAGQERFPAHTELAPDKVVGAVDRFVAMGQLGCIYVESLATRLAEFNEFHPRRDQPHFVAAMHFYQLKLEALKRKGQPFVEELSAALQNYGLCLKNYALHCFPPRSQQRIDLFCKAESLYFASLMVAYTPPVAAKAHRHLLYFVSECGDIRESLERLKQIMGANGMEMRAWPRAERRRFQRSGIVPSDDQFCQLMGYPLDVDSFEVPRPGCNVAEVFDFLNKDNQASGIALSAAGGAATVLQPGGRLPVPCGYCGKMSTAHKRCTGCNAVYFCGPVCLRAAWPEHKAACRQARAKQQEKRENKKTG